MHTGAGAPSTRARRERSTRCCRVVARCSPRRPQLVADAESAARDDVEAHATNGFLPRRSLLALGVIVGASSWFNLSASPALAEDSVNDPAALKAKLEAQYKLWAAKQYDAWLATQGGAGLKWQSSYAGVPLKLKGKEGAASYFATLNADLDIQSYKPLAIFVDNDGDEATVMVEAAGASRRTKAPFKTIFLHTYIIGPNFQVLKFKEQTDTQLLAALVPTAAGAPGAAGLEGESSPVPPGPAARTA
ncbi:hypothetical protein HXX76_003862 [Chlamydomonas incerta]|uniref:Uncharacterized protein n=1 Tax=Chlamydomonas incerta TaxID=51695 RepID=A0A835T8Y9_CHLIN|nr:hypothetical protein HXX76_003862 [Chlamydomonas incerta]|eukprot:KAG2441009.1 hypothetical protein HXX76_003862 [Chlamydomonas incerta]